MISRIEEAIVDRIKTRMIAAAGKVAVQKGVEDIRQPGVYVSTEAARFVKVTSTTYRQELTLYVDIVFSHLGGEGERRKGVYLILDGVIRCLLLQTLGLAIAPLLAKGWKNTTIEELRDKGLIAYSLELQTSCNLTVEREEDAGEGETPVDLMAIGLNYYLKPGDDLADAVDIVTLGDE